MIRSQYLESWFYGKDLITRPQPFAIITAHSPRGELRSWTQNGREDEKLWRRLKESGHDPKWIFAGSKDWSYFEPSWTVSGISPGNALDLGRAFGQDAIFWVEDGTVSVHDCASSIHQEFARWGKRCISFWNPTRSDCVYAIQLDNAVWEKKKFAEANIDSDRRQPCFYVGMTAITPVERFARHKAKNQACPFVTNFGRRIAWERVDHLDRMSRAEAKEMEGQLAWELRQAGHGVWHN